jgi:hypothetical protein
VFSILSATPVKIQNFGLRTGPHGGVFFSLNRVTKSGIFCYVTKVKVGLKA